MVESQKNIIETLLKEKGKTKRELAKVLDISENSVNRTVKNPSISVLKMRIIADFLGVDIIDLLPKKETACEQSEDEFQRISSLDAANRLTISNLSEALNRNSKTIENLVQIIAENFPEKKD